MKFLNAFGITQRLYLVSFALISGLVLVALLAWSNISEVSRQTRKVATESVPHQLRLATMELNVTRTSLQLRHAILVRTPADLKTTLADIGEKRKLIDTDQATLETAATNSEERAEYGALVQALTAFWAEAGRNVQLIEQAAATPAGQGSPPTRRTRTLGRDPGANAARAEGVKNAWVTPSRSTSRARAGPGRRSSGGGSTSRAPAARAAAISSTEASKLSEAFCRTRLSRPVAKRSRWASARLTAPRWSTTTPLGRPVEPEV